MSGRLVVPPFKRQLEIGFASSFHQHRSEPTWLDSHLESQLNRSGVGPHSSQDLSELTRHAGDPLRQVAEIEHPARNKLLAGLDFDLQDGTVSENHWDKI
ncbi:hypothetical protein OG741_11445 [Streptomyces sp. NBC_01410]